MSGITGGGARKLLRPLRPDGNVRHDLPGQRVVGNHKGDYANFNILNPRGGTVHQFATKKGVLGARNRGWWVGDPERDGCPAHALTDRTDGATPLDTVSGPHGMVHMVTSEDNFRRLMEEQAAAARHAIEPQGDLFLDNISAEEMATTTNRNGRVPTRFAIRGHGVSLAEGGVVREQLTPSGIVRQED